MGNSNSFTFFHDFSTALHKNFSEEHDQAIAQKLAEVNTRDFVEVRAMLQRVHSSFKTVHVSEEDEVSVTVNTEEDHSRSASQRTSPDVTTGEISIPLLSSLHRVSHSQYLSTLTS
jgi:hypothetical protein